MKTANTTTQANTGSFPITINLTLDQLKTAYRQLLNFRKVKSSTEKDWMEESEMAEFMESELVKGRQEYERGECLTLSELQSELQEEV